MSFDVTNKYYSGQGVVMLAKRDVNGNPLGFVPLGNVSDLKISVGTTTLEHKEAQSGQRAIDLRLVTETKCSLSMTVENFIAKNLADALRGDSTAVVGATATDESVAGFKGMISPLAHIKVSAVSVKTDKGTPVTLTAYPGTLGKWDYKVNLDAGSIMLNPDAASWDALISGDFDISGKCPLLVSYTYAAQSKVDALTQGMTSLYMRFEGLNTADDNAPVVVEVFKFATDPLKELSMLSDKVQEFVLEGSVLADPLRPSGSNFFKVTMLA